MKPLSLAIDLSELPEDKRNSPEALEFCERVKYSDPSQIKAASVHETAHGIYMLRAGAINIERRGFRIGYDNSKHEYFVNPASVNPVFPEPWEANLDAVARYYAAGGVAVRELTAETIAGDEKDYEDFCQFCKDFFPACSTETRSHWGKAQTEIKKDLRSPKFRKEVWKKADEFEQWLLAQSK